MYGTVARLEVKPGMEGALAALGKSWAREEFENSGQIAELIFRLDGHPNEFLLVAAFPDRDTYFANADRPATQRNYAKMRELLVEDPEWNDGEIVDALGIGNGI